MLTVTVVKSVDLHKARAELETVCSRRRQGQIDGEALS